jgi:hypothetical protein
MPMPFAGIMLYAPDPTKAENLNDPPGSFKAQPGCMQYHDGKWYRYVIHDNGVGNIATTNGKPAFTMTKALFKVTPDKTSCEHGASNASGAEGVYLGVVTDGYGTWIQVRGRHVNVQTTGPGAVGQNLTLPASDVDSFTVAAWTTVASQTCGVQLGTVDATHVIADLDMPL